MYYMDRLRNIIINIWFMVPDPTSQIQGRGFVLVDFSPLEKQSTNQSFVGGIKMVIISSSCIGRATPIKNSVWKMETGLEESDTVAQVH